MKKAMLVLSLVGLMVFFVVQLNAAPTGRLRVTVPFDFYVGTTHLSAGDYIFEMRPISPYSGTSTSVVVWNADRAIVAFIATMPGSVALDHNQLHFSRYGNQFFLSKVESSGLQAGLRPTSLEKELLAEAQRPQSVIVASK
jgi:hypothetical protein